MKVQEEWKRSRPDEVQKVGWKKITIKYMIGDDGKEKDWTTMHAVGDRAAGVIALTPDNKVVIAKQYRPGPEKICYEIPGGGVEADEDPKDAAVRELYEECGYVPGGEVVFLGMCHKDAYTNMTHHYYLAFDCERKTDKPPLDEGEFVETMLLDIEAVIDNAKNDNMSDAHAVFLAYETLLERK